MADIKELDSQLKSIKSGISKIKPANELIKYIEDVRATVEDDYEDAADWLDNIADEIRQWYNIIQNSTQLAESAGSIAAEAGERVSKAEQEAKDTITKTKKEADEKVAKAKQDADDKVAKAKKNAEEEIAEAKQEADEKVAKAKKEAQSKIDEAQKAIDEAKDKIAKAEASAQQKIGGAEAEINEAKQKANAEVAKAREEAAAAIAGVDQQVQKEVAKQTEELRKATAAAVQEAKEAQKEAADAKEELNSFNSSVAALSDALVTKFNVEAPARANLRNLVTLVNEINYVDPKTIKKETLALATAIGEKFTDTLPDFSPRTTTIASLKITIEELDVVSAAYHKRLQKYCDQAIAAFKEKFGAIMLDEESLRSAKDFKAAIDDLEIPNPQELKQLKQLARQCVMAFINKFGDNSDLTSRSGLKELGEAILNYTPAKAGASPEETQRYTEQINMLQTTVSGLQEEIRDAITAYRQKFGPSCGLTEFATLIELKKAIDNYTAPKADNAETSKLLSTIQRLNSEVSAACDAYIEKFGTTPELVFNKTALVLRDALKKYVIPTPSATPAAPQVNFEDTSVQILNDIWKDTNRAINAHKQGKLTPSILTATIQELTNRCDSSQLYLKQLKETIYRELTPKKTYPTEEDTTLINTIRKACTDQGAILNAMQYLMKPTFINNCTKTGLQEALVHTQGQQSLRGLKLVLEGRINDYDKNS